MTREIPSLFRRGFVPKCNWEVDVHLFGQCRTTLLLQKAHLLKTTVSNIVDSKTQAFWEGWQESNLVLLQPSEGRRNDNFIKFFIESTIALNANLVFSAFELHSLRQEIDSRLCQSWLCNGCKNLRICASTEEILYFPKSVLIKSC